MSEHKTNACERDRLRASGLIRADGLPAYAPTAGQMITVAFARRADDHHIHWSVNRDRTRLVLVFNPARGNEVWFKPVDHGHFTALEEDLVSLFCPYLFSPEPSENGFPLMAGEILDPSHLAHRCQNPDWIPQERASLTIALLHRASRRLETRRRVPVLRLHPPCA